MSTNHTDGIHPVTQQPEPPTNVRVRTRDGATIPCELIYLGTNDQGIHEWEAVTPIPLEQITRVFADILPAMTSIRLALT